MRRSEEEKSRWMRCVGDVLLGGGIGVAVCCLILLLGAAMICGGVIDGGEGVVIVSAACLIGGLAGGILTGKRSRAPSPLSAVAGLVQFVFTFTVGAIVNAGSCQWKNGWLFLACSLAGSCAAFLLFRRKERGGHRRRRHS